MTDARTAALNALDAVTQDSAFTSLALKKHLPRTLSLEDASFANLLVRTTLENLIQIDFVLNSFIKSARGTLRNILRLGACQLLYLNTQSYAAINESAALAKRFKPHSVGFVNAVLRSVDREKNNIIYPKAKNAYSLSVSHSYPLWICEKYINDFGYEFTDSLLGAKAARAVHVRANALKTNVKNFETALAKGGFKYKKSNVTHGYYIESFYDIESAALYKDGLLTVQSESAMRAVEAIEIKPNDKILDCCAAPGGKSAYAAALTGGALDITAWDIHPHRIEMMKKNFERLNVKANVEMFDALLPCEKHFGQFDAVIVDAPCSAMGLMHKNPDIRYKRKREDIDSLSKLQRRILDNCSFYVKKGGKLVYMTCSINREENENVVNSFLEECANFMLEKPVVTRYPNLCGSDGFFYAVMNRK